jgi:DNA-directed RNA polymerase subunit beta'
MRTFHIGGAATGSAAISSVEVKNSGTIHLHNVKTVKNTKGNLVTISRSGELIVQDKRGANREKHKIPYGAELSIKDGQAIKSGDIVAEWDPHTHPIVSEASGKISFIDMVEDVTYKKQSDDITGLTRYVITDLTQRSAAATDLKPAIMLVDKKGEPINFPGTEIPAKYFLPGSAILMVDDGKEVKVGDIMAKNPREGSTTRDITGGLPRVAELFEARKPKEPAILAEVGGVISFGKETKGKQRLVITDDEGENHEFLIAKGRPLSVVEGESVIVGDTLVDGPPIAADILRLKGVPDLLNYIVAEVQDVYRLQGVKIDDKHIEVIVRQMLRKVTVLDPGDTMLLPGEQLERVVFLEENDKMLSQGKRIATAERNLLGITKASLLTESFISAASFQETTRVLTEASIIGKTDSLRGLKENVIVGRLIPAGTGLAYHQERHRRKEREADEKMALEEFVNSANSTETEVSEGDETAISA